MTRVYQLTTVEGTEWALPVDERLQLLDLADGGHVDQWVPFDIYLLHQNPQTRRQLAASDLPWYSESTPILKQPAHDAIEPFLGPSDQLLPLRCAECPLWVLNVTERLDVLDEGASDIVRVPDTERILKIRRHAFDAPRLAGVHLFKLPQMPRGSVFFTDGVAESLGSLLRVGLELVWEA